METNVLKVTITNSSYRLLRQLMMKSSHEISYRLSSNFSRTARLRFGPQLLGKFQVCIHSATFTIGANKVSGFCKLVDRTTLLNDIMTTVEDLVSDTSQHVRAALGTQISGLAPILGKQEYVIELQGRTLLKNCQDY